jgi:tetratricopeptide (TPR) repeat protein
LDPAFAEAYYYRGRAYYKVDGFTKAVEDEGRAIELKPNHARAYFYRGRAHAKLGHREQAIDDLTRAIELGLPDSWQKKAEAYLAELGYGS